LILPESELRYVPDTLEWVSNPDSDLDSSLFADSACRVYAPASEGGRSWTSVAKRVDDETDFPYLLFSLCRDGVLVQVHIPLCLRDEDLDGHRLSVPERAITVGQGHEFREAVCTVLPLARSPVRSRPRGRTSLVESAPSTP
jgi:hypothetical protein